MNPPSLSERTARSLEQAIRPWQALHLAGSAARASAVAPAFTVAVSREAGANATPVAHAVGKRLDWPVYDRELLRRIAEEMGLRAEFLEGVDEKQRSWLQDSLEGLFSSSPAVSQSAYIRRLTLTLFSLAAQGECVIVGRGAAQVLPAATTLRVRLIGPRSERIDAVRRRLGLTPDEAARWVETTDRERTAFVKDHFHKDPTDVGQHDLVLNTSRFSPAECAELIVEALHRLQAHVPARELASAAPAE